MALARWKTLARTTVFKNPWWTYRKDQFELPSGAQGEYHVVHTNGSSMVVPVRPDGRLVMVNQYRYLNDRESLEFPCGGVKDDHTYDQTATQELEEETGLIAAGWMIAGEFNPFNGATDEICRVFIARDLHSVPPRPEVTEEFEIITLTPEELDARIVSGVVWDGMTIAAWTIARNFI